MAGRPKSRKGKYERITLEVREDLLGWLNEQQESRREVIEAALIDLKAKKESKKNGNYSIKHNSGEIFGIQGF